MLRSRIAALPLLALALAACDQSVTGVTTPPREEPGTDSPSPSSGPQGTLVGRVELAGASATLAPGLSLSLAGSSATTVAATRIRADGSLEVLATGTVAADGAYRIAKVPAGIDRLLVVASNSAGTEVGRVIAHQGVSADGSAAVAPLNGETTVEGRVFAEMIRSGMPKEAINTVELAQGIEASGRAGVEALLRSTADLRALADGVRARQDAYTQVLALRGISLDAGARFQASLPAAAAYASARDAGATEAAAEAEASAAVAEALEARGVTTRTQAEGAGAAETALLRAASQASNSAHLEIARAALQVDLLARQRLILEALVALGAPASQVDAVKQALASALTAAGTAESRDELVRLQGQVSAAGQTELESLLLDNDRIPAIARDRVRSALRALPSQTELQSRLGTSADAAAVAGAYVQFFDSLRSAVESAVNQLVAAGGKADGEATADSFTALRGLVQIS